VFDHVTITSAYLDLDGRIPTRPFGGGPVNQIDVFARVHWWRVRGQQLVSARGHAKSHERESPLRVATGGSGAGYRIQPSYSSRAIFTRFGNLGNAGGSGRTAHVGGLVELYKGLTLKFRIRSLSACDGASIDADDTP
jgi:hypothetical protein